jgi:hypothetical protein
MLNKQKEILGLVLKIIWWTLLGLALGWGVDVFQQAGHRGDLHAVSELRSAGNLWIGGAFGFFLGLIKAARG